VNQLVEESQGLHATSVNLRSVGFAHEGSVDDPTDGTQAVLASAKLVKSICTRHGIPCDRSHVIGHKEANDLYCGPGHTDPGSGWNWTKFMGYVNNGCGGSGTGRLLGFVYKNPTNDAASRLAGATVTLSTGHATTDAGGVYTLASPPAATPPPLDLRYRGLVTRTVTAGADTWAL
jgi:hypothetical protein